MAKQHSFGRECEQAYRPILFNHVKRMLSPQLPAGKANSWIRFAYYCHTHARK